MNDLLRRIREYVDQPIGQLGPLSQLSAGVIRLGVLVGLVLMVSAGLVTLLSWGNLALASQSGTCVNCHELKTVYDNWATSTHKGIGCLNCHVEPTLGGYLAMNVRAMGNIVTYVAGDYETPLRTHVSDGSCLKCHPRDTRPEEMPQASLRIAHSKHEQQQCADCHGRLVHKDTADAPVAPLASSHEAKDCKVCHASPKPEYVHGNASVACSSCHSGNIPRHELAVVQGVMPREGCQDCHSRLRVVGASQECQRCHVSPHGIEDRVDVKCTQCHTAQASWTAHQLNHPVELVGKHADVSCAQCHDRSRTVPAAAPAGAASDCRSCHEPKHVAPSGSTCSSCHTPEGWKPARVDHKTLWDGYAGKHASATCNQCHEREGKAVEKPDQSCASCHKPPEKHFGTDCVQCHESGGRFKMSQS